MMIAATTTKLLQYTSPYKGIIKRKEGWRGEKRTEKRYNNIQKWRRAPRWVDELWSSYSFIEILSVTTWARCMDLFFFIYDTNSHRRSSKERRDRSTSQLNHQYIHFKSSISSQSLNFLSFLFFLCLCCWVSCVAHLYDAYNVVRLSCSKAARNSYSMCSHSRRERSYPRAVREITHWHFVNKTFSTSFSSSSLFFIFFSSFCDSSPFLLFFTYSCPIEFLFGLPLLPLYGEEEERIYWIRITSFTPKNEEIMKKSSRNEKNTVERLIRDY